MRLQFMLNVLCSADQAREVSCIKVPEVVSAGSRNESRPDVCHFHSVHFQLLTIQF